MKILFFKEKSENSQLVQLLAFILNVTQNSTKLEAKYLNRLMINIKKKKNHRKKNNYKFTKYIEIVSIYNEAIKQQKKKYDFSLIIKKNSIKI